MRAAIDALEDAFRATGPAGGPLRTRLGTPAGQLLLMPAAGGAGVGVKLVTLTDANPERGLPFVNAVYVLFDVSTQVPLAVIDGAALTALRTAAVSGLATRHLAREDASRLVLFGAGVQARSHLDAMLAERAVTSVVVVSRTAERAESLAAEARARGVRASVGSPGAVAEADLVCCCTTAGQPLFDGAALAPGAHVNAVGAYEADRRELDTETVRRSRVVVETREVAMAEAGDVAIPIGEGAIGAGHLVADLAELVRGARVRRSPEEITVFKSVGMAFEDLAVARAAADAG
ncbi:MAG: ornithine cyclodeaminase family protein [Actinobacteria bacterium]|nr:ornithine cyclodeaminase family protein [Actinomycetota bacterium]